MSFSTTVQFPDEETYQRLKVLSAVRDEPVGAVLADLVDGQVAMLDQTTLNALKEARPDLWEALK